MTLACPVRRNQRVLLPCRGRFHKIAVVPDLTGVYGSSRSERESLLRSAGHADEEIQAGADRDVAAADRSGNSEWKNHTASLQGSGDHASDLLPLEKGIRRPKAGSSEADERTGEGEREAEAFGSGAVS